MAAWLMFTLRHFLDFEILTEKWPFEVSRQTNIDQNRFYYVNPCKQKIFPSVLTWVRSWIYAKLRIAYQNIYLSGKEKSITQGAVW